MPNYKIKGDITGWETWEYFTIPLFYMVLCRNCKKELWYRAQAPKVCSDCGAEIAKHYKGKDV